MQGLTLAIPEMVPFRLTQNLVDAFGVSGYEGAYRRACEVTLQVCTQCFAFCELPYCPDLLLRTLPRRPSLKLSWTQFASPFTLGQGIIRMQYSSL